MKLAVLPFLLCARLASAQPASPGALKPLEAPAVISHDDDLSPSVGVLLSFGGTAASWTVMIAGLREHPAANIHWGVATAGALGTLVAPSLGHWYARSVWTPGLKVRLASTVTGGLGLLLFGSAFWHDDRDGRGFGGLALLAAGGMGYIGGTVYDLATVGVAVQHYNERSHQVALVPVANPTTGSYGLALGGQF